MDNLIFFFFVDWNLKQELAFGTVEVRDIEADICDICWASMEMLFGKKWRERGRALAAGHSWAILHNAVYLLYLLLQALLQTAL